MSQEIIENKAHNINPTEMIMAAVTVGTDLDKLKGLMELQFQWEANEARKKYAKSFANAQMDIETIVKTKTNNQTHSKYADLSNVIESAKPVYTKEGFSIIFYEGDCPKENYVRVFADVLHSAGHKETYHFDVPMDGKGLRGNENMTAIHGKASSVAYARRYLMCMIWNIPTADDDGNKAGKVELITEKQLSQLFDLLAANDKTEGPLCKYLGIESLDQLPASQYSKAEVAIKAKKAGVK